MSEAKARKLIASQQTLIMATAGKDGVATASYAPFVYRGNCFYVYMSSLSRHTKDLLEKSAVSVLLIEDEADSKNLFARKRLTFSCHADVIASQSDEWSAIMELFEKKFKKVFALIRPLADFTLFRLMPKEGLHVLGFGRAYRVDASLKLSKRVTGGGHKTR